MKCFPVVVVVVVGMDSRKSRNACLASVTQRAFEDDACIINSGTQNAGIRGGGYLDGQASHQGGWKLEILSSFM